MKQAMTAVLELLSWSENYAEQTRIPGGLSPDHTVQIRIKLLQDLKEAYEKQKTEPDHDLTMFREIVLQMGQQVEQVSTQLIPLFTEMQQTNKELISEFQALLKVVEPFAKVARAIDAGRHGRVDDDRDMIPEFLPTLNMKHFRELAHFLDTPKAYRVKEKPDGDKSATTEGCEIVQSPENKNTEQPQHEGGQQV